MADDRSKHIVEHQWQKGQSGNPAGRPKGSINKKTLLRAILDVKITNDSLLLTKLRTKFPELFADDKAEYSLEFIITLRHVLRAITGPEPDRAIIDILDRIHGRPIQSFNLMNSSDFEEEQLTTDQVREQLEQTRALRAQFEKAANRQKSDPDYGQPDTGRT